MEEPKLTSARAICEYIEQNGGGKVDAGVIRGAIEQGWNPRPERVQWPSGEYVK